MFESLVPWRERSLLSTGRPHMWSRSPEMDEVLGRFFGRDGGDWLTETQGFVPTVDLVEAKNQFEVTVDLPGLKPEEVTVELKNGDLWITGKRETEEEEKGKTVHRLERRRGEFRRILPLPTSIDEGGVEAEFDKGILRITVPKTEEAKTKRIAVKS